MSEERKTRPADINVLSAESEAEIRSLNFGANGAYVNPSFIATAVRMVSGKPLTVEELKELTR